MERRLRVAGGELEGAPETPGARTGGKAAPLGPPERAWLLILDFTSRTMWFPLFEALAWGSLLLLPREAHSNPEPAFQPQVLLSPAGLRKCSSGRVDTNGPSKKRQIPRGGHQCTHVCVAVRGGAVLPLRTQRFLPMKPAAEEAVTLSIIMVRLV